MRRGLAFLAAVGCAASLFAVVPTVRQSGWTKGWAAFGEVLGRPQIVLGPGWGRTLTTGTSELTPDPEGGWTLKVRAECPATNNVHTAFFELTVPASYRYYELDGVRREFPATKGTPFLGDGKRSFTLILPNGDTVTFDNAKAHIEDGRCWKSTSFIVRFFLMRGVEGDVARYAFDCKVRTGRAEGRIRDFCRVPKGVPDFRSTVCAEGPDWIASDFGRFTKPGSPLDFSEVDFNRVPGGKTRYFGGNCSWSAAFLEKDESDRVADEVKRLGYNIVRAHQHDTQFLPKGATESYAVDAAAFDKFDYFVAALKKRGISFTTDCYSSRKFLKTDPGLGDIADSFREMKGALAVRPEAMSNWKAFARTFLCHVNPYTGLALKDDPTLVCLNLVNEDNYDREICKRMPLVQARRGEFATAAAWETWLFERQMEIHREQIAFLKAELGVKAPVTSLNMCSGVDYCRRRSLFDVVDLHMYFAHPTYWDPSGVRYPHVFHSQIGPEGQGMIMLANFFQRDWTRPCLTTEYRQCAPNVFRSECGALVGAYAALQDWQGLVGYGYAAGAYSFRGEPHIHNPFDTASDPVALMMDRQTALLFRRGDVRPAHGKLALRVPEGEFLPKDLPRHLPRSVRELGLFTGVGFLRGDATPAGIRVESYAAVSNAAAKLAARPVLTSDTDELSIDRSNRVFRAETPRSEVLLVSSGRAAAKSFSVELLDEGAASVSLHALDDAAIARSKRLLAFHITDSVNDGTEYADGLMRRIRKEGKGRVLIRRQRIRVRFAFPVRKVTALKCDGSEAGVMKPEPDGSYVLRTDAFPGGVLAYSIVPDVPSPARLGADAFRGIRPAVWEGSAVYRDLRYGPRDDAPGEGKDFKGPMTGQTPDGRRYNTHRTGQFFDLIVPAKGYPPDARVYVNFHGGAWSQAFDKDGESMWYLKRFADAGFVVVNADYMMPMDILDVSRPIVRNPDATFLTILRDIDALATCLKYDVLPAIGVCPTKFVLGGGSAGGHISALYGYDQANPSHLGVGLRHDYPVGVVVDVVGPTDLASDDFTAPFLRGEVGALTMFDKGMLDRFVTLLGWLTDDDLRRRIGRGDVNGARRVLARFSPNRMVTKDSPPTVFAYCRQFPWSDTDGCVPTSAYYDLKSRLEAVGVPHRGDLRSWRIHGWLRAGYEQWVVDSARELFDGET